MCPDRERYGKTRITLSDVYNNCHVAIAIEVFQGPDKTDEGIG
jgi:hypothetical protein